MNVEEAMIEIGYQDRASVLHAIRQGALKIRKGEITPESVAKVAARRKATEAERAAFLSDTPVAGVTTIARPRKSKGVKSKKAPRAAILPTGKADHNRTCVTCGGGFTTVPKRGRPHTKCEPCRG